MPCSVAIICKLMFSFDFKWRPILTLSASTSQRFLFVTPLWQLQSYGHWVELLIIIWSFYYCFDLFRLVYCPVYCIVIWNHHNHSNDFLFFLLQELQILMGQTYAWQSMTVMKFEMKTPPLQQMIAIIIINILVFVAMFIWNSTRNCGIKSSRSTRWIHYEYFSFWKRKHK